ncbi:DUF3841 domain-containing protein [Nocardioides sp. R1-1]|uniref:DUF3841 domain-containing protein n=1 Tax=Nocardioides sp. R1-1 TaxID=3383502 RepID=UPI0038D12833
MSPSYEDLPQRRWWRIVSPVGRRRLGDLSADPLILRTFQSAAAYRVLAETGVLEGDPTLADADLGDAYSWMKAQADRRLATDGPGLLWLWPTPTRRSLIDQAKHARGDFLLTVRMPREHVLLSEFSDWHIALNSGFHVPPEPGESDDEWWSRAEPILDDWDDRLRAAGVDRDASGRDHWPPNLRDEAEASWEAILDPATWRPRAHVQAVAQCVHAEQVVAAVRIRPGRS